jgi:hypothetical protein
VAFNPSQINNCGGFEMHHLMIKKCLATGLKYLCKTSSNSNPYTYTGSGKRWLHHIKKHNSFIITCIIGSYNTKEELKEAGLYYSQLYNVVKDQGWANLTEEKGDGGLIGTGQLGKTWTIKDTKKMKNKKTKTEAWYQARKKIAGKNNYQYKGHIKTPWGIFETGSQAIAEGKIQRKNGNHNVVTDGNTLRKYLHSLDSVLNLEGRRTPKDWRGKTPREIGFDILKDSNVKD